MQHKYLCAQCGKVHALSRRDTVRCGDCGYRIMYKLRDEGARYMCVAR
jgi:DNA-directed RNA polymerase subunit RPC12/RpoP